MSTLASEVGRFGIGFAGFRGLSEGGAPTRIRVFGGVLGASSIDSDFALWPSIQGVFRA